MTTKATIIKLYAERFVELTKKANLTQELCVHGHVLNKDSGCRTCGYGKDSVSKDI